MYEALAACNVWGFVRSWDRRGFTERNVSAIGLCGFSGFNIFVVIAWLRERMAGACASYSSSSLLWFQGVWSLALWLALWHPRRRGSLRGDAVADGTGLIPRLSACMCDDDGDDDEEDCAAAAARKTTRCPNICGRSFLVCRPPKNWKRRSAFVFLVRCAHKRISRYDTEE